MLDDEQNDTVEAVYTVTIVNKGDERALGRNQIQELIEDKMNDAWLGDWSVIVEAH